MPKRKTAKRKKRNSGNGQAYQFNARGDKVAYIPERVGGEKAYRKRLGF